MQFDDRLATVLRMRVASAAVERTQFRQLLDLLGTASGKENAEAAYARLDELRARISAEEQAHILREAGLRLRNPQLVAFLAEGAAKPAASALATAKLSEAEWEALIPRLPVIARGFLRHRRDLPLGALRQLRQLGVGDLVLGDASAPAAEPAPVTAPKREFADLAIPADQPAKIAPSAPRPSPTPRKIATTGSEPISDIIERIEQFRHARRAPVLSPRLPLGDAALPETQRIETFDMVTDASGLAIWASAGVAPWIVGMDLTGGRAGSLALLNGSALAALRRRQPLHHAALTLAAAPAISGDWRLDAAPVFTPGNGAFAGYRCRALRAVPAPASETPDTAEDRMRQVLHELRTPVNAIQGFAEIIQQQLFGAVPHDYRAHAAAIAVDAARLLSGFEDLDRLAQLETGALVPEPGEADMRAAVGETLRRLDGVLKARNAGFDLAVSGSPFIIPIDRTEALTLCWRLLASAAGALSPGEHVALGLIGDGGQIRLELELPASLREPAATPSSGRAAVSAGMFGPQFAFRLASAEAKAAGGEVTFGKFNLTFIMPVLTAHGKPHSRSAERGAS